MHLLSFLKHSFFILFNFEQKLIFFLQHEKLKFILSVILLFLFNHPYNFRYKYQKLKEEYKQDQP